MKDWFFDKLLESFGPGIQRSPETYSFFHVWTEDDSQIVFPILIDLQMHSGTTGWGQDNSWWLFQQRCREFFLV